MRAAPGTLATLEVPVRRGGAALARREDVRVHAEAHRAAGAPPLEARLPADAVEALVLPLPLRRGGARHDHRANLRVDALAGDDRSRSAQVLDGGRRAPH